MNTQTRFIRSEPLPNDDKDQQQFITTLLREGVEVAVGNKIVGQIPWEQMEDVDFLATAFWHLQVWQFRIVIEMLGKANRSRGLVE